MKRWENVSYQKIENAKFHNELVIVTFENGDVVKIPKDNLIPLGASHLEWEKLKFGSFEITIPADPNTIEIAWDKLRVLTDKEFGKYLAEKAGEQSKLIGGKIKRLREQKGITSKDLAERSDVTPQTISRIEQGHTDVGFATLRKILAAMGYSLKDLANQEAEAEDTQKSLNLLIKRLSYAGVDSNLLTRKILPKTLQIALNSHKQKEPSLLLDQAASYVSTIYGWSTEEIWGKNKLTIRPEPAAMAFFKKPNNANENQVKAYSHYAYYLAKVVINAFQRRGKSEYPSSIEEFKQMYFDQYTKLDLNNLLNFVWDLGICVLPLNDSGVFHGASWNIEGRHVIVLKQINQSHARWIFDLLHELYHVFAHLDEANTSVIEVQELTPFSKDTAIEESEANSFANQVIFGEGNRAEELAEKCVALANWDLKKLSRAIEGVAKKENVREDFLSNYLAFRLSFQGENWWSSAIKFQITDPNPFDLTTEFLKKKIQIQNLNPTDFNLLNTAIN